MTQPQAVREVWRGLACTLITLPNGDSVRVSDFGAQVLSWNARGHERMFCSERAVVDGSAAIRCGVPVCFPQFNQRGPLPKHGLARVALWEYQGARTEGDGICVQWNWRADEPLHAEFAHGVDVTLTVQLSVDTLQITLAATNIGSAAFAFTGALHTYLAVQGADMAALYGLDGAAYWDAAKGFAPRIQQGAVWLGDEVDRVYARSCEFLELRDATGMLRISQDEAWPQTVVWNPGAELCARLPDMQPADWMRMLCVEAAAINQPIALHPGQHWQAAQTLQVVD